MRSVVPVRSVLSIGSAMPVGSVVSVRLARLIVVEVGKVDGVGDTGEVVEDFLKLSVEG